MNAGRHGNHPGLFQADLVAVCVRRTLVVALLAGAMFTPPPVLKAAGPVAEPDGSGADSRILYVGTYTRSGSEGIYTYRLDLPSGQLQRLGVTSGIENPSFVAVHPNRRFLYAVSEVGQYAGLNSGGVYAYAIDGSSGALSSLNHQSSRGTGPCHLVVDQSGKYVLVANYGDGSVACLPIQQDGRLQPASSFVQHTGSSVNPRRQAGPHAHSINVDAANRFAIAADLGLDKLLIYRFDSQRGQLRPNQPAAVRVQPGAGPRHFAFHPGGQFAYVINELHSTVTAFVYDRQRGKLRARQTISTLPDGYSENNSTAEVQVHPSGRFLYGSNRGHDSIAVFAIDGAAGTLTAVEHEPTGGSTPRNFGIDPTGKLLLAANQRSNTIVVMRIDPRTGELTPVGAEVEVPSPVCIKFL